MKLFLAVLGGVRINDSDIKPFIRVNLVHPQRAELCLPSTWRTYQLQIPWRSPSTDGGMVYVPGSDRDIKVSIPNIVTHASKTSGQVVHKCRLDGNIWLMVRKPSRKCCNGALMLQSAVKGREITAPAIFGDLPGAWWQRSGKWTQTVHDQFMRLGLWPQDSFI